MKTVTNEYKQNIIKNGRELDSKITYTDDGTVIELGGEELNSITPHHQADILKSVMKQLDIDSNVEIPVGTVVNYQFGVKTRSGKNLLDWSQCEQNKAWNNNAELVANAVCWACKEKQEVNSEAITFSVDFTQTSGTQGRVYELNSSGSIIVNTAITTFPNTITFNQNTTHYVYYFVNTMVPFNSKFQLEEGTEATSYELAGQYEYVNYGNYIVKEIEKNEDTNSYQITCYDKMLYSMVEYEDMGLTYPVTVRSYINAIATHLGLTFKNASDTFANYNQQVKEEYYLTPDGDSMGYTFRDVLDELAEVTASIICINEDDDELEIRYPNTTNITLDEEYLKDVNVKFKNMVGPYNTVVLSRGDGTDKIGQSQPNNLPDTDKIAIEISDNQIMNDDDRSDFIPDILAKINGLSYYLNGYSSPGITFLELGDKYNIQIGDNTYNCLMLNDDTQVTQGLSEDVSTEEPNVSQKEYVYVEPTDKTVREASIKLDKRIGEVDIRGKTINMTADDINITSTNFSVDSTGRITATSGNIAGFETNNDGFSYEIVLKKTYDTTDIDKIQDYLFNGGTLTDEELDEYDINNDGVVNVFDLMQIIYIVYNMPGFSGGSFKIKTPPANGSPISVKVGLYDNNDKLITGFDYHGVYSQGSLIGKYSTNETVCGEWIDANTLYRQVLSGTLPVGNGKNTFTISGANIVNVYGMIKSKFDNWWKFPNRHSDSGYSIDMYINDDRDEIAITCGSYFDTNSEYEIVVEYTKTTN